MEKDIDRIAKNSETDIVIRIDDFGGKPGVTIREFVRSERYTGFTKAGTRIAADKFKIFKAAINSIDEKDLEVSDGRNESPTQPSKSPQSQLPNSKSADRKPAKKKVEKVEPDANVEDSEF